MKIHRIRDALAGKNRVHLLGPIKAREEFKKLIEQAEFFDFGKMHMEPSKHNSDAFALPRLTEDEEQWWSLGLIPVPAPVCYYEFQAKTVSGILVQQLENGIKVQQIDLDPDPNGPFGAESCLIDGIWTTEGKTNADGKEIVFTAADMVYMKKHLSVMSEEFLSRFYAGSYFLAKYLTLMLSSKTTDIKREHPPEALNKARMKRGKPALPSHYVVNIIPQRFHAEGEIGSSGKRMSPRLHWRRSHLRVIRKPDGTEQKIVIARMLVGRRELGEVTHEYRVSTKGT